MPESAEPSPKTEVRKTSARALAQDVGRRISAARGALHLSSETLAEAAGVTRARLSVWENGRGLPDALSLVRLCRALGVEPSELLGFTTAAPAVSFLAPSRPDDDDGTVRALTKRVDALARIVLRNLGDRATPQDLSDLGPLK